MTIEDFEYQCRLHGFTAEDALRETAEQTITIGAVVDVLLAKRFSVAVDGGVFEFWSPVIPYTQKQVPEDYTKRQKMLGDILISIDTGGNP